MPITNQIVFQNRKGYPLLVSGVPPDAFSETGQLWGRFIKLIHKCFKYIFWLVSISTALLINLIFLHKVLYMIGKQWRKMDFHGGYVASEELKIYMMNSE